MTPREVFLVPTRWWGWLIVPLVWPICLVAVVVFGVWWVMDQAFGQKLSPFSEDPHE